MVSTVWKMRSYSPLVFQAEYQNLRYTADISVQERIRTVIIIQENETIAWKRPSLLISW